MLAASNGHREVVSLLLAAGSNPNARDNLGSSALLEAVKGGWDILINVCLRDELHINLHNCLHTTLGSYVCTLLVYIHVLRGS